MEDLQLSNDFWLSEFLVNLTDTDLINFNEMALNRIKDMVVNILQPVRNIFGKIDIISGYRSVRHNEEVNGSQNSYHLFGAAADIVPREACVFDVFCWIKAYTEINNIDLTELELKTNTLHIAYWKGRNDRKIWNISPLWKGKNCPYIESSLLIKQYQDYTNKKRGCFTTLLFFIVILLIILNEV